MTSLSHVMPPTDIFNSLSLATMMSCQLSASAAVDANSLPEMVLPSSGGGVYFLNCTYLVVFYTA